MKIKMGMISVIALSSLVFAGCGQSSDDSSKEEYSSQGKKSLKQFLRRMSW